MGAEPLGPAPFYFKRMNKLILILLPVFLLSFSEALPAQEPPKLVVRNRVIQLESIPSRQDTTLVFHYENKGGSPLEIFNMIPGCTCVVPDYSKEPLMAGDSTSFTVRFTPSHPGPFSQAVTIVYAAPGSPQYEITRVAIRGEAHE